MQVANRELDFASRNPIAREQLPQALGELVREPEGPFLTPILLLRPCCPRSYPELNQIRGTLTRKYGLRSTKAKVVALVLAGNFSPETYAEAELKAAI